MSEIVNVQFVLVDSVGNEYISDFISVSDLDKEVEKQGGIDVPYTGVVHNGTDFCNGFVKSAVDTRMANVSLVIDGTTQYFNPSLIFSAAAVFSDAEGNVVPVKF